MQNDLYLGIDIGSVTIKTALLDLNGTLLFETCTRIKGDPAATLVKELLDVKEKFPETAHKGRRHHRQRRKTGRPHHRRAVHQ